MATYPPPSNRETLTIFNPDFFVNPETSLTQAEADLRYLRFPIAQGLENLQAVNVSGVSTFTNDIVQIGATNNIVQDQTTNTDKNILKGTEMYGDLALRKPTSVAGGGLRLYDVVAGVNSSQIYTTGTQMALVNLNNSGLTTFTTTDGVGVQSQVLQVSSTDMTIATTNPPTCNASSVIALSDDSAKLPSTAWVRDYISSLPSTQYTYTQQFTGSLSLYSVPIPTGCVKFDIKVIGTGGLATATSAQPPSGGETEYTLQVGGSGGGAGVAYKDGITISKQGTNYNNSLTYINYGAGLSTEVKLNNESLCQVYSGGNAGYNFGGAGCTTAPIVNTNWGNWVYFNGQAGQNGPFITYNSPPDAGQVGGGNKYGGVIGNPVITSYTQGSRNVAGSGQLYGALAGPSYGFPSFSASPINYGGVIITWYIQS